MITGQAMRTVAAAGVVGWLMAAGAADDRELAPRGGGLGLQIQGSTPPAPSEGGEEVKADFTAWAGSWVLAAFGEEDGTQAVPEGVEVTFILRADGKVSGRSACNTYGGQALPVAGQAGGVRFGPMFSTRMACPGDRMQVEQRYLAALGKVARGSLVDTVLRLADGDGTVILVFQAK